MELLWKRATPEPVSCNRVHQDCAAARSKETPKALNSSKPAESLMLDLLPPVYLVALGLGLAAVFVVLFYSFTSNSNYESQMRRKQLAERRAKQAASEAQSSADD
jgi:hypothetical protein